MKQGLLNIISELMERKLFLISQSLKPSWRYAPSIRCFEKLLWQFLKRWAFFLQTKGSNQKEIEHFIQSLQILENPQLVALLNYAYSNIKNLSINPLSQMRDFYEKKCQICDLLKCGDFRVILSLFQV